VAATAEDIVFGVFPNKVKFVLLFLNINS
jgi:hypothetical protein